MSTEESDKKQMSKRSPRYRALISFGKNNNYQGAKVHIKKLVGRDLTENTTIINYAADSTYDVTTFPTNPYLGLDSFTYAERERYAGREIIVGEAVSRLVAYGQICTLLFITGASGSGKSSFAQAGVLPALEGYYLSRKRTIRQAVIRPSAHPLAALADVFMQLKIADETPDSLNETTFAATLQHATPPNIVNVIIVDQFEELFSQSDPSECDMFFTILKNLPTFALIRSHIIVTLRSDYLGDLFQHPTLFDIAKNGIDLRVMTVAELKESIQKPLHHCFPAEKKAFEPALLDKLATDAAVDAALLPLLQVTLKNIWARGILKLGAYTSLAAELETLAETAYRKYGDPDAKNDAPPTADQQTIMQMFVMLVKVLDEDPRHDVRQRRTIDELCGISAEKRQLMNDLVDARLLTTGVESGGENKVEVVDIIHETLLTNWPRLRDAIVANRTLLHQRTRFTQRLQEWKDHNQNDDYLLVGVRLAEAEQLMKVDDPDVRNEDAKELVGRSVAIRERKLRKEVRNQRFIIGLLTVLIFIGGIFALDQIEQQQAKVAAAQLPITIRSPVITIQAGRAKLDIKSKPLMNQFVIEQFEVSQRQYRMCVEALQCDAPDQRILFDNRSYDNHPMVYLTPRKSWEYCLWIKRRLPTSAEWERAVRGREGRSWTWGDTSPTLELAHMPIASTRLTDTLPVNTLLSTTPLPEGPIYHLVGNVSEFVVVVSSNCDTSANCHLNWDGKSAQIALAGGDYKSSINQVWRRLPTSLNANDQEHGFRCGSSEE